jgi:hypothetical protein
MKRYDEAISAAEEASEKDENKKNSAEIQRELKKAVSAKFAERSTETEEETLARAMRDPEVQSILSDPVMNRKPQSWSRWCVLSILNFSPINRNSATSTARPIIPRSTFAESRC